MLMTQGLNDDTNNVDDLLHKKLIIKQQELDAMVKLTEAINTNVNEDNLYRIYNFTLRSYLDVGNIALFIKEEKWQSKVQFGTTKYYNASTISEEVFSLRTITHLQEEKLKGFEEFDVVIPVWSNNLQHAIVFVGGLEEIEGVEGNIDDVVSFIHAFTNILVVAIENKRHARRQLMQQAFRKELEIASEVQTRLFPRTLPEGKDVSIFATYFPHHDVGGDYYDYLPVSDSQFVISIADVSGKGVPAALLMSNFQAALKVMVRQNMSIMSIVKELNHLIVENVKGEYFITAFLAVVDLSNKLIIYVNAGHNPPILVSNNDVSQLDKGTTILGAFEELPFMDVGTIRFDNDSLLFAYTDGLTETHNNKDDEFGVENLIYFLQKNHQENNEEMHSKLISILEKFKEGLPYHDDVTMVSLKLLSS